MNREIIELREVIQKLVPLLTGKGLTVTQRGSQAYVTADPVTKKPISVNIPNVTDNATPEFVRAIQGYIDHEVAHVLITDWKYYGGGVSDPKEIGTAKYQSFQNIHNILEDTMIERGIVDIFPGSRRNIADLRKMFIADISLPAIKKAEHDPKEQFRYLIVPLMRALAGHEEFVDMMDTHKLWDNPYAKEVVGKLRPETLKLLKTCKTTKETLEIARELHAIVYPPEPPAPPMPESEPEDKPDAKAGPGRGTGERDHSEETDEEAEKDDEGDAEAKPGATGSGDEEADEEADEADAVDPAEESADDEPGEVSEGDEPDGAEDPDAGDDSAADDDTSGDSGGSAEAEEADEGDKGAEDGEGDAVGETEFDDGSASAGAGSKTTSKVEGHRDDAPGARPHGGSGDSTKSDGGVSTGLFADDGFEDDAFDKKDLGSAVSQVIGKEALTELRKSEYTVFTREYDRIEPLPIDGVQPDWVPKLEDQVRQMIGRMQKDIERMMASQSHVIRTPGHRNGKLHPASLYRVPGGDERVFSQRQEHVSKDTVVSLLVDNSGSMSGAKQTLAMIASYALSLTLERVGISHEVLGFTTRGFHVPPTLERAIEAEYRATRMNFHRTLPLYMPIYKGFEERVNSTVKQRFAKGVYKADYLAGNIDGECLEYAAMRLMKRREKRRVMLVLSDGAPIEARGAPAHLRYMVDQLTNKWGIDCIGIGIMDDSVSRFYPKFTVLRNVNELPVQVMQELKKILT